MAKRHLKNHHPAIARLLIGLMVLFCLCLIIGRLMIVTSYRTQETAQTSQSTIMTTTLLGTGTHRIPAGTTVKINRYYLLRRPNQQVWARVNVSGKHYFARANQLILNQNNQINDYIASRGYPHRQIKPAIDRQFSRQGYHTLFRRPRGVIVHDTGTEHTTVSSEVNYMENNYGNTGVFVHTFISAHQILNIANVHYMAQGAGPNANPYFVQFEMPHEYTRKGFAMQLANAAYYTATILRDNHLPVIKGSANGTGTIWTHSMVSAYLGGTDHQDPNAYWTNSADDLFSTSYNVNDFIDLVQAYYNRL